MLNHIPVRDAVWFKRHFRQLYFKADWSEIHFLSKLSLPFYVSVFTSAGKKIEKKKNVAFTWLAYMCEEALGSKISDENITFEGERSIKAA